MENGGRERSATEQVREGLRNVQGDMRERIDGLREYAEGVDSWIRTMARERPMLAIGLAVGLGFLVGRLASRA